MVQREVHVIVLKDDMQCTITVDRKSSEENTSGGPQHLATMERIMRE